MAAVWNTTFDSGRYFIYSGTITVVGYSSSDYLTGGQPMGSLADTGADMYSGATLEEFYFYADNSTSGNGYIFMQFNGNVTGAWTHVKIGPTIFQYGDFTRTYTGSKTQFKYQYNHKTSDEPHGFPDFISSGFIGRTRLTFHNSAPSVDVKYGVQVRNASNNITWTNEEEHILVCAAGVANITEDNPVGYTTVFADNVDRVAIWLLDTNNDNAPYDIYVDNITTTSFRIYNGSLDTQQIGYTAFRTT
jgi:hypothetical protein